jgi:hypothetical protein
MSDQDLIAQLTDDEIVALTLYGEARGEGQMGLEAVASVIVNRVKAKRFGPTARAVCLAPWQFSCWKESAGQADYLALIHEGQKLASGLLDSTIEGCLHIALEVVDGTLPDSVQGSTHYVTEALYKLKPPAWAKGQQPTLKVGRQLFFAGIK